MLTDNCNPNYESCMTPSEWDNTELEARAGALVKEALANWPVGVKKAHWTDMVQTAVLAFLEHADKPFPYGYGVARTELKNYKWVHIQGLNGGWKSLVARNYTVSESPLEVEGDDLETTRDNLHWRLPKARPSEIIQRPVEWRVFDHLTSNGSRSTEAIFQEILTILAGTADTYWYPERIYRAALIIAMILNDYIWEDVEQRVGLDYVEVHGIWHQYKMKRIQPFRELPKLQQEMIYQLGQTRLVTFDNLSFARLNWPTRKMVVFDDGIYTVSYKQRTYSNGTAYHEGVIQRGRRINGKTVVRGVNLGTVGEITKQKLLDGCQRLEEKLTKLHATPGSLGRLAETRHTLFARA